MEAGSPLSPPHLKIDPFIFARLIRSICPTTIIGSSADYTQSPALARLAMDQATLAAAANSMLNISASAVSHSVVKELHTFVAGNLMLLTEVSHHDSLVK